MCSTWFDHEERTHYYSKIEINDVQTHTVSQKAYEWMLLSGIAKGGLGRTQALPNDCSALPLRLQKIKIL